MSGCRLDGTHNSTALIAITFLFTYTGHHGTVRDPSINATAEYNVYEPIAGSSGAWSRNFSNGAVRGSAAAVSPDFIRAMRAVASLWVRV